MSDVDPNDDDDSSTLVAAQPTRWQRFVAWLKRLFK